MKFEITRGVVPKAQKVVVYGPEGIGKTTLAAQFPKPLFIDTEGGSSHLDVDRLPAPTSWKMLMDEVEWIRDFPHECGGTLVLDTADWAERLCVEAVCKEQGVKGIEDFGYGKGYTYAREKFGKLLDLLSEVCDAGLNVVVTAHAVITKFEQPDEMGAYDRWGLKLIDGKKASNAAALKEWADAVLFCNFKTIVVTDKDGKKAKAQGGRNRVMYATHAAAWDAKNRWGLPDEVPMEWGQIAPHIPVPAFGASPASASQPVRASDISAEEVAEARAMDTPIAPPAPSHLRPILDLMATDGISKEQLVAAIAKKGYMTADTPMEVWDEEFAGWVESAWAPIVSYIRAGMPDEQ